VARFQANLSLKKRFLHFLSALLSALFWGRQYEMLRIKSLAKKQAKQRNGLARSCGHGSECFRTVCPVVHGRLVRIVKMNVIAELKIVVSETLKAAAQEHFDLTGAQIQSFRVPSWMFQMLKKESCFLCSNIGILGKFCGFIVIDSESCGIATMYEEKTFDEYLVFGEA
jgi:hypothetical protein